MDISDGEDRWPELVDVDRGADTGESVRQRSSTGGSEESDGGWRLASGEEVTGRLGGPESESLSGWGGDGGLGAGSGGGWSDSGLETVQREDGSSGGRPGEVPGLRRRSQPWRSARRLVSHASYWTVVSGVIHSLLWDCLRTQ